MKYNFYLKPTMLREWEIVGMTKGCYVITKNGNGRTYLPKKNVEKIKAYKTHTDKVGRPSVWDEKIEKQLLTLKQQGLTFRDIEEILGISFSSCSTKYKELICEEIK